MAIGVPLTMPPADGKRQQTVGLEQWISEQEARCETGFCYCQICHPSKDD